MLNSGLYSQHSLPPSGSICATPPHLPVLLPLYAIWFMNSTNITVLFRKKKITFSFDPLPVLILLPLIPFLLQKSLLSPFFRKDMPFFDSKITTSVPFENSFISADIFCQLPPHFRSPFPSVWSLKNCCIFLTALLLSAHFTQIPMMQTAQLLSVTLFIIDNPSYFWTKCTFYLLNISTLKLVSYLPLQFIKVILFCSAETSDPASSYIHPPLILEQFTVFLV